jgi:hypothetical protein
MMRQGVAGLAQEREREQREHSANSRGSPEPGAILKNHALFSSL